MSVKSTAKETRIVGDVVVAACWVRDAEGSPCASAAFYLIISPPSPRQEGVQTDRPADQIKMQKAAIILII